MRKYLVSGIAWVKITHTVSRKHVFKKEILSTEMTVVGKHIEVYEVLFKECNKLYPNMIDMKLEVEEMIPIYQDPNVTS